MRAETGSDVTGEAVDRGAWDAVLARSRRPALDGAPISGRGLLGQVVHAVGPRILSGDLAPGEALPNEATWADQLGVSRTILREATKVLISKGLLESRPKTGTRVRPAEAWNLLDPDVLTWQLERRPRERFVREIFELRRAFEPSVAALAASRASPAELREMAEVLDLMEEAGDDGQRFIGPDTRFHRIILEAAHNGMLRSLSGIIDTALTLSMYLSLDNPRGQRHAMPLHRAIHRAFLRRDPKAAHAAMDRLIDEAEEDALRALRRSQRKKKTKGRGP
ncbi:MAG: FadR family transcriptional regulator [Rhizobiales bacterium]|nr:FadR family transcriptional regulator [Hyphomicrobiales bacterium]MBN9010133.1 FadR family transcriptional regulator [Hyphomicrobiales bacterium]